MRVIITEKPATNRALAEVLDNSVKDEEVFFIEAQPYWLNDFKLPKGLSLCQYPYFGDPAYRRNKQSATLSRRLSKLVNGRAEVIRPISLDDARDILLTAREIVCACDWDHTGIWGFDLFIEHTLGKNRASSYPVWVFDGGLDTKSIVKAFEYPLDTNKPDYLSLLSAGKAKRLFEYNYAVNSLAVLGNLYRKLSGTNQSAFISKYALQTLIWLNASPPIKCYELENMLANKWMGTGKYPANGMKHLFGMGSAISRQSLINDLVRLGLAEQSADWLLTISSLGKQFVAALHPDCKDVDLPFRIDAWMCQGVETAEPAIKRYLNTFFGKQLKFEKT